jgi:hypothetical protein
MIKYFEQGVRKLKSTSEEKGTFLRTGTQAWPYSPLPQPDMLRFQAAQSFLYSGKEVENWTYNEYAAFINEVGNFERYWFMAMAAGYLVDSGTKGDYHEYGTFGTTTFRMFLTHAKMMGYADWDKEVKFYGFDSYEGLPEFETKTADGHVWTPGSMAYSEEAFWRDIQAHGMFVDRVETVKGFFNKTLTPERQKEFLNSGRKIAFANIDCDLYESAVPVFEFIEPLLQEGSLIYIDDYFSGYNGNPTRGVAGAFNQYKETSRWAFQDFRTVGHWGRSFIAYPR